MQHHYIPDPRWQPLFGRFCQALEAFERRQSLYRWCAPILEMLPEAIALIDASCNLLGVMLAMYEESNRTLDHAYVGMVCYNAMLWKVKLYLHSVHFRHHHRRQG